MSYEEIKNAIFYSEQKPELLAKILFKFAEELGIAEESGEESDG